ncbi:MAG: histidinol phosphate phosphatase domain-containing protein [Deltaproteobacteria bacterium]|nr:histidinol phosphate phosphatase domain-containing protein [Deltaproteobacteria bacterium]
MIDLHTHSIFSDGELIPSELVRRAVVKGYRALAITDHGDHSNVDFIIPRIATVCRKLTEAYGIAVLPGIELTHVPPSMIGELANECRVLGALIVVVHGETIAEPVMAGTNRAALEASVDILAHPGLISEDEAFMAAKKAVYLEVTTRKGHSLANGHVVAVARKAGAPLVLNTDSHSPQDLVSLQTARRIAQGAGLTGEEVERMFENSETLLKSKLR